MRCSGKMNYVLMHWRTLLWTTIRDVLSWIFVAVTLVGSLIAFMPAEEVDWLHDAIRYSAHHPLIFFVVLLQVLALQLLPIGLTPKQ